MEEPPRGEYAEWVVEKPERLAAVRAYLDMLDVSDDKREDMIKFMMIVLGLGKL
jgi:hypothetical protein